MTPSLIDRLREAKGADRELSNAVLLACGWRREEGVWFDPGGQGWIEPGHPHPTASIDAALTLVPAGWEFNVSNRAPAPHCGRAYIHNRRPIYTGVGGMRRNTEYQGFEATAATPAIALCIAALEARAAMAAHTSPGASHD